MSNATSTKRYDLFVLAATVPLYMAGYLLLRFDGLFASNDATVMSRVAAAVKTSGSLTTPPTYSNGFGYPAVVSVLSSFTGVPVSDLQLYLMPFLLALPVLAAYVFFREVGGDRRGLFTALLVLVHPFFLFSAFRSTHEKFTYTLLLLVLYCLYVSFTTVNPSDRARHILIGYVLVGGLAFLNVYFTVSFISAVTVSFGIAVVLSRYYGQNLPLRRLKYTLSSSSAIFFVVVLFLYPPAYGIVSGLETIVAETISFIFETQQSTGGASSPYRSVGGRWDPFFVYFVLISFYFVVYPIAGLYWLGRVRRYLGTRSISRGRLPELFVLALFAAFGLQFASTIAADQTGLMAANMQLRIFPLLGFMAALLTGTALYPFVGDFRAETSSADERKWYNYARTTVVPLFMVVLLVGFGGTALLKASGSGEPALSTGWTATTDDEESLVEWTEAELSDEYIWSGYKSRLRWQYQLDHPRRGLQNRYEISTIDIAVRYLLISDVTRKHAAAGNLPLPPHESASRIYSNGGSRLYWFEQYRTFDAYDEAFRQRQ